MSWHLPHLRLSLELIRRSGVTRQDAVIDVGGGESTLVDDLLDSGFKDITVLDISANALECAQRRLADRASEVTWIAGDIVGASLPAARYRLWHDRAVFHFLTDPEDRRAYTQKIRHSLQPGGFAVISTFSVDGPPKCSGLQVQRYSAETLLGELGTGFKLFDAIPESHRTPSGATQAFIYCLFGLEGQPKASHS